MTAHFKLTPSRLRSTLKRFAKARGAAQPAGTARPHSGLRMAPVRWASQDHPKVVTISQFAAHMDGEASFWPAYDPTPPRSPRRWRQFRSSQPPGPSRPHSDLRVTSLRWTRQQPPKVVMVSLRAAPRDGEVSFRSVPGAHGGGKSIAVRSPPGRPGFILIRVGRHAAGSPQEPTNVTTVSQFAAPRDGEVSF